MIREWWKRHFDGAVGADVSIDSNQFERCRCCGQAFNSRDLKQVLPHFEHQLALGAPRIEDSMQNEDLPPRRGNIVPFRDRSRGQPVPHPFQGLSLVDRRPGPGE